LILKLAEQDVLALDAPMSRYLPKGYRHRQNLFALNQPAVEDAFPVGELQRLTARMILTHSSGLPNWASDRPLTLAFEPGTAWRYSGEGFVLLQRAAEAVTGQSLEDLARRLVFVPMGMQRSSYRLSEAVAGRLVPGKAASAASGRTRALRFPDPIASGSLYTTADDYAAFMARVLQDKALTSRVVDGAIDVSRRLGLRWGLGWGVEETPQGTNLWHWGRNPGYCSLAMASLQSGNGIVVFTNDDGGMPVAKELVQAALPGEHGALRFAMLG
jgi:CubicO group peptidase (beta-lactamase class C family)